MKKIRITETELTKIIRRVIKEQEVKLPTDSGVPVPTPNEDEIRPAMTHSEFMDQLDGKCSEIIKKEKMVGNRSCHRCHIEIMDLLHGYCIGRK